MVADLLASKVIDDGGKFYLSGYTGSWLEFFVAPLHWVDIHGEIAQHYWVNLHNVFLPVMLMPAAFWIIMWGISLCRSSWHLFVMVFILSFQRWLVRNKGLITLAAGCPSTYLP